MNNSNLPLLSVIIPLYNCEDYIERTLISMSLQNINMEIIVVDDGSTDNGAWRINALIDSGVVRGGDCCDNKTQGVLPPEIKPYLLQRENTSISLMQMIF